MDISTAIATTQFVLVSTLLGFLVIWMVTFAVLALYPNRTKHKNSQLEELPTPARPLPAISAPRMMHKVSLISAHSHQDAPGEMLHYR